MWPGSDRTNTWPEVGDNGSTVRVRWYNARAKKPKHASIGMKTRHPSHAQTAQGSRTPEWVHEGFLAVQAIENTPHGLRLGLCTLETPQNVRGQRDPAIANRLEEQGINFVILDGVRGMGMTTDMPEVRANGPLARALKERGIRRVLYVQSIGQIVHEPFFAENPQAADWVQRGPDGQKPTFGVKWFQYIPCLNNPDVMAYVERLFREVMRELDLDGIFTDLYGYFSYSCFCEHCKRRFADYIERKYPDPESRRARFGFSAPVSIPPFRTVGSRAYPTGIPERNLIVDPVSQEWIRFRCERLGEVTRKLSQCIKECNPNGVLYINYPYGGAPGLNNAVFHGLWPEHVLPECDLFGAEVAGKPELLPGGVVKGRAIQMKVAKAFNIPVTPAVTRTDLRDFRRLYLAEGMAFNTAPFDWIGQIKRDDPPAWMRDYMRFCRTHRAMLGKAATIADCAVLHSFESLSFTCSYPHASLVLCEQSLLQESITFNVIFEKDLDDLARYPCLFLANVVSMSRNLVERIVEYVLSGGSVVATEDTSVVNENMLSWKGERYRRQKTHLLSELLGVEWPEHGVLCYQVGAGRLAILACVERPWQVHVKGRGGDQEGASSPHIALSHSFGPGVPVLSHTKELATNHKDILAAVDYALAGERTLRLKTNRPVIGEVTKNTNGCFVHLLNWDESTPVVGMDVSLSASVSREASSVELLSPDHETKPTRLEFTIRKGRIEFEVPRLVCYDVVVVR